MKIRDIILDFTSLLDVIMILLFFFFFFSYMEIESTTTNTKQQYEQAKEMLELAEQKEHDAQELANEAGEALERIESLKNHEDSNIHGIYQFSLGKNIQICIEKTDTNTGWNYVVIDNEHPTERIFMSDSQTIASEFNLILKKWDYPQNDTILCVFVYDSNEPGTRKPFKYIKEAFEKIQSDLIFF